MAVYKTGGDVDSYCNKCKLLLAHVIIAMDGARPVRVECKTCRAVHAYKKSVPGSSSGTRKPREKKLAGGITPSDYEKVIKGHDLSRAQRYKTSVNYAEGDVLDHTTFGLGIVSRLLGDQKMEVVFPVGLKVLVHSREAQA